MIDLDAEERPPYERRPYRLRTLRQLSDPVERAQAIQRMADAAEEAMSVDQLVAEAVAKKRAAKRATRRVLRRLKRLA